MYGAGWRPDRDDSALPSSCPLNGSGGAESSAEQDGGDGGGDDVQRDERQLQRDSDNDMAAATVHTQQNNTSTFSTFSGISLWFGPSWLTRSQPDAYSPTEGCGSPIVGGPGVDEERQLEKCVFRSRLLTGL